MARRKTNVMSIVVIVIVMVLAIASMYIVNSLGWLFSPIETDILMFMIVIFGFSAFLFQMK